MSIFEKNSYFLAMRSQEGFKYGESTYNSIKKELNFQYGYVTSERFSNYYDSTNWIGRKFTAIPLALGSGVILSTYHLAKAILIGIPTACCDRGTFLKIQLFLVLRDFQSSFGRIMTLFNDRYGSYHIQESHFHKICYDLFQNKMSYKDLLNNHFNHKYAHNLSPALELYTDEDEFKEIFPLLIEKHLKAIPGSKITFVELDQLNAAQLNDLFYVSTSYKLAKITPESFTKVIYKLNSSLWELIPTNRFYLIDYQKITKEQVQGLLRPSTILENRLEFLTATQVLSIYRHLSKEQKKNLKSVQLENPSLKALYNRDFPPSQNTFIPHINLNHGTLPNFFKQQFRFNFFTGIPSDFGKATQTQVPINPLANYYKILEIPEGSSASEIKTAFKAIALKHHPDKLKQGPEESKEDFEKRVKTSTAIFDNAKKACEILLK